MTGCVAGPVVQRKFQALIFGANPLFDEHSANRNRKYELWISHGLEAFLYINVYDGEFLYAVNNWMIVHTHSMMIYWRVRTLFVVHSSKCFIMPQLSISSQVCYFGISIGPHTIIILLYIPNGATTTSVCKQTISSQSSLIPNQLTFVHIR